MPGILLACSRPQDAQAGVPRHRMGSSCCIKPGLCCGAGAGAVLDALLACGSLQELVLSNNSLGTGVLTNLATVLVRCGALQRLSLSNVNAQTQGVSSLCQVLLRPTCGVTHLDLASNALQPEVCSASAPMPDLSPGLLLSEEVSMPDVVPRSMREVLVSIGNGCD